MDGTVLYIVAYTQYVLATQWPQIHRVRTKHKWTSWKDKDAGVGWKLRMQHVVVRYVSDTAENSGSIDHDFCASKETAAVVASWFVLNITIASSTKWILVHGSICFQGNRCTQYQFPVAITVLHMIFSWLLCRLYIFSFRKDLAGERMGLMQQVNEIMPLSLCFALSVAMGNLSLKYIYPSFNQMLGSMSPLITVLLAVILQRRSFPLKTWLSMPVICVGLAVCSAKELNFNALGAFYATGATVLRAVKSLIQGRLLSTSHKMDSVTLLYYMAPWAAIWLTILMLLLEGKQPISLLAVASFELSAPASAGVSGGGRMLCLLMFSGLNACLLNIANFLVTS